MGDEFLDEPLDDEEPAQRRVAAKRRLLGYAATSAMLVKDSRRVLGNRPLIFAFGEWVAAPLFLLVLQATVLTILALTRGTSTVALGYPPLVLAISIPQAFTVILVVGLFAAALSYLSRWSADRAAIDYELKCNRRAVEYFHGELRRDGWDLGASREAILVSRSDARSCGTALRILLLSFPWVFANLLIFAILAWIEPVWTLWLLVATAAGTVVLVRMNRKAVQASRDIEGLREKSLRDHHTVLKAAAKGGELTDDWSPATRDLLTAHHQRLKVQAATHAVTNLLFVVTLAAIVPTLWLRGFDPENLVRLAFYVLLLRIGVGYIRRVAAAWGSFNQHFPASQRYFAIVLGEQPGPGITKDASPASALTEPQQ